MRSTYMFKQISRLFEAKMVSRASDIETDGRKSQNCSFLVTNVKIISPQLVNGFIVLKNAQI